MQDHDDEATRDVLDGQSLNWGDMSPRGGRAVMSRILKENATVPLFFAQTLIQSLRDVGYNHTTSALCEHVDNAIQAKATEVRIFFRQQGKRGQSHVDVGVYDNGQGMSPNVLKVATAFGGSMNYGNRAGIARFGMGMKTAALSMSPVMELYSWQERKAIYSMMLDVEAIGKERGNMVQLPDPTLAAEFPDEISDLFRKPMSYPKDQSEQELTTTAPNDDLYERLGASGTVLYMPKCDRLTYATAKTLVDHAVKEMSRVYRRAIASGLRLYINNRLVTAFDPTYAMPSARHTRFLEAEPKQSRLVITKTIPIALSEGSAETAPIQIKIYRLPEEWASFSRKVQRNDLRIFDGLTVSILRNDREVFAGPMPKFTTRHAVTNWYRVQIDFPGVLDEAFGVAANKQGVRLKGYVEDAIKEAIGNDVATINDELKRVQAAQSSTRAPAKPSTSEAKAGEADAFQTCAMPSNTPEEEAQLDANLRGLALTLRREGETEEQAFERVKCSQYIIAHKHDEYWPFYEVKHRFGRIILTINTAHPFFTELYDPVSKLSAPAGSEDDGDVGGSPSEAQQGPIVALELLLLSLARTQSRLAQTGDDAGKLLELLRREWSDTYRIQITSS